MASASTTRRRKSISSLATSSPISTPLNTTGPLAMQLEHSGEVGAGDAADGAHRHPVFREVDALPRFQERVGLLVAHQPRLHLDVGAVIVGEGAPPVETVGIHAPRPDLL